jgi:small subunit ribosomal protein S17
MTQLVKEKQEGLSGKRELEGIVVSDKMDKTIVVEVVRVFKHPLLGKVIRRGKKYQAHDELGKAKKGDRVRIQECRPLSKRKHMVLSGLVDATSGKV